jgi:hypothetical protein
MDWAAACLSQRPTLNENRITCGVALCCRHTLVRPVLVESETIRAAVLQQRTICASPLATNIASVTTRRLFGVDDSTDTEATDGLFLEASLTS